MLHILGNSHVNNFSNSPSLNMTESSDENFKLYHLGPTIAYNFEQHHLVNVFNNLKNTYNKNDKVTLVVGEVDCRLHLPLRADQDKKTDEEVTKECVTRFSNCYIKLRNEGYDCFVTGTHPTTPEQHDMSRNDRPIYSSPKRRNNICLLWNNYLEEFCIKNNFNFINIYDKLVNDQNETISDFFIDYCHLNSSKVFNFYINKLKEKSIL